MTSRKHFTRHNSPPAFQIPTNFFLDLHPKSKNSNHVNSARQGDVTSIRYKSTPAGSSLNTAVGNNRKFWLFASRCEIGLTHTVDKCPLMLCNQLSAGHVWITILVLSVQTKLSGQCCKPADLFDWKTTQPTRL